MKMLQKIFAAVSLAVLLFVGGVTFSAQPAFAATTKQEVCEAIGSGSNCTDNNGGNLSKIITTIVNILSLLVGVTAVIMIVWSGFKYITSGGDSGKVTSAKNALVYALVGLVIVALAQFMVRVVLKQADNATKKTSTTQVVAYY